jgi:hypothetical protein
VHAEAFDLLCRLHAVCFASHLFSSHFSHRQRIESASVSSLWPFHGIAPLSSDHKGDVKYEWALLREGTMTRLESTDKTLTINNANPSTDFGVYRCEVETAEEGELLGSATTAVIIGHSSQSSTGAHVVFI